MIMDYYLELYAGKPGINIVGDYILHHMYTLPENLVVYLTTLRFLGFYMQNNEYKKSTRCYYDS